jgi:hypothetical protein|uniref:Tail protein n=1 Tax=Myoviridae sp. ctcPl3 TaxID=2826669 RepID=A0A8S5QWY6_9CAUD|nr:MAG TPA: tail protein [Myoviridae sp. ctcPl3]
MKDDLFINGKDAYITWGISMDNTSLSALMTPAPNKEFIENKSRLEDGKQVIMDNPKIDERNITLAINLTARNEDDFFAKYESFCEELATGTLNIRTRYQPDVMYRTIYISCNQFTQFMRGIGKFTLKLCEPLPTKEGRKVL